jgi:DNA polymerase I-like protein with 3'-5' exonuclease and polymerase domains
MKEYTDTLIERLVGRWDTHTIVFDIETTAIDGDPSPHLPDNQVVCIAAYSAMAGKSWACHRDDGHPVLEFKEWLQNQHVAYGPIQLVAHNAKFDLGYLLRSPSFEYAFNLAVAGVWDTMVADYILSGQENKFSSLNSVAAEYLNTTEKKMDMEFPPDGAASIEKGKLLRYAKHDVTLTQAVQLAQLKRCSAEQRVLISVHGMALVGYTEMERRGLRLDMPFIRDQQATSRGIMTLAEDHIRAIGRDSFPPMTNDEADKINWTSSKTLSTVLHGVPGIKVKTRREVGKYMNGNPKYKTEEILLMPTSPLAGMYRESGKVPNETLGYPVNEKAIKTLLRKGGKLQGNCADYLNHLMEFRKHSKLYGTYWDGLPQKCPDPRHAVLHPSIHQVATNTARSSSSNPNGQNIPDLVREAIKPATGYEFLDVDFKQLEVCGLGLLTQDPVLLDDLNNGRDVHNETGKVVYPNKAMSKDERRDVKLCNFLTIYGGTAKTMAGALGLSLDLASRIQRAFYDRYRAVKVWQDDMIKQAKQGAFLPPVPRIIDGAQARVFKYVENHGRTITWHEQQAPKWMRSRKGGVGLTFSPTELKNYRVQSIATGDIAPMLVALTMLMLMDMRKAEGVTFNATAPSIMMNMAVHDSILLSCQKSDGLAERTFKALQGLAGRIIPKVFSEYLRTPINVPLRLDGEVKPTWYSPNNTKVLGN